MTVAPPVPLPSRMVFVPGPVMIDGLGARMMVYGCCMCCAPTTTIDACKADNQVSQARSAICCRSEILRGQPLRHTVPRTASPPRPYGMTKLVLVVKVHNQEATAF